MAKKFKVLAVAILVLFGAHGAFAQEEEGGFDFGLSIGIGAETYDGKMWQTLKLSPDIAIGKFGIGLELTLNYTFEPAEVRSEDWMPRGDDGFLDVYLPKFKYIRYGFKADPLFAQFGSIEYALLGNGFIMGGYDNTVFLPFYQDRQALGLSFDLDGALFNFPYVGIETFVGNLAQFDVLGSRLYVRPLAFTDVPIIKGLQVGGTLAVDRKPKLYAVDELLGLPTPDDSVDPVVLYGADLTLPILTGSTFSFSTFADIAFLHDTLGPGNKGKGEMVGFGGRLMRVISYGAQIRVLGEDFIPTYFDTGYDLYREEKYNHVIAEDIESYLGWLGSLGFSFLDDALVFKATVDGPIGDLDTDSYLDYPHLYAVFILGQGIIPNISLEAQFDKRSLFDSGVRFDRDAVIAARVNYSIGAAVLSFVYQRSIDRYGNGDSKSGIGSSIQLF
jgi:hypothetical protein